MGITNANDDSFSTAVSSGTAILEFWAPWCGPCKLFGSVFEQVSNDVEGLRFVKVNTDEAQETTKKFEIRSVPTIVVVSKGKELERFSGVFNREQLKEKLKKFL